jgi:outer membrane receptor protein involved in Fe transport
MQSRSKFHSGTVTLLFGAALCAPLWAAEPQQPGEATSQTETQPGALEEIVITATRRETTVQNTAISITAVDAAQIASRGLVDLNSVIESTPGLAIRDLGGPMDEFEIRGLNSQGGNSSMVGAYFGEIPLATSFGSQFGKGVVNPGLYDLNRVEVLRGPQGTLYGASSMGGTIRLIPNDPQLNTNAAGTEEVVSGTISGGGINHAENGMLNLPLGDTAAVRIVGSFSNDSGWVQRNVFQDGAVGVDTGGYPNTQRPSNFYTAPLQENLSGVNTSIIDSIRAQFLWKPVDELTVNPTFWYQYSQLAAPPSIDVNGDPTHPTTPQVWAHWEPFDTPEPQTSTLSFGSLNVGYRFPTVSLTSATGYWNHNFISLEDGVEGFASALALPAYDASAGGIGNTVSSRGPGLAEQDSTRQISEELRVNSNEPVSLPFIPGKFDYVAGYFYEDIHSTTAIESVAQQGVSLLGGPALFVEAQPEILVQNAVYGHLSWRLSPQFEVEGGFRHYNYSLGASSFQYGAFSAGAALCNTCPYYSSASIGASGTIPSLTLTYNIDPDHMAYAKIDKGVRLGGVSGDVGPIPVAPPNSTNPLLGSQVANECAVQAKILLTPTCNPKLFIPAPSTFNSDSVWSYEIGEKSYFLDRHLIANLDGYFEKWSNPQLATELAGFGLTVNGAPAHIWGIELQLDTLLPGGFDISLNGGYTNSKFVADSAITGFTKGMQIPDTPAASGSAVLHWVHDLGGSLSLLGSIEGDYTGTRTDLPFGVTATLDNVEQVLVHMPAYAVGKLRFGFKGNQWTASMFVNNFTNNHSLVDPQPNGGLQTTAFDRYVMLRPLTAGVDLAYRFE